MKSILLTASFLVAALFLLPARQAIAQQVTKGEYFIDIDPGFGSGKAFSFTAAEDITNAAFNVDFNGVMDGFHRLYIRFRNETGTWGITSSRTFFKMAIPPAAPATVVRGESFMDKDPGFGNGNPLHPVQQNGEIIATVTYGMEAALPEGFHKISTRFLDAKGVWGHTHTRYFFHQKIPVDPATVSIHKLEYAIDFDQGPGHGKLYNIPEADRSNNVTNIIFEPDLTGVEIGAHKLYVRGIDQNGKPGITQIIDFRLEPPGGAFITLGTLPEFLCENGVTPVPFTLNAPINVNNTFYAELSDEFGSFGNPERRPLKIGELHGNQAGIIQARIPRSMRIGTNYRIRVVSTNPRDTSNESAGLNLHHKPGVVAITGDTITCLGNYEYQLWGASSNPNYTWKLYSGGQLEASAGKATVNWTTAGVHTIEVTDHAICAYEDSVKILEVDVALADLKGSFKDDQMLPKDNEINITFPVTFSWNAIENAVAYDLYIWEEGTAKPTAPTVSNLTGVSFVFKHNGSFFEYGKSYRWYIVAKRACQKTESREYIFRFLIHPDLIATEVTGPASVFSEGPVTVNYKVKNTGSGAAASQTWSDLVYLSADQILSRDIDHYLGSVPSTTAVNPGATYSGTGTFDVPVGLNGPYYIIVVPNGLSSLTETDYNNNAGVSNLATDVQLTPPPDLQVTSIIRPGSTAFSGQFYDFSWTVTNKGTGPMRVDHWWDNLYLSPDNSTDLTNAIKLTKAVLGPLLEPGKVAMRKVNVRIPNGLSGKYYIIVETDVQGDVYEHSNEDNNIKVGEEINLILTPPIDMVPVSLEIQESALSYDQIPVKWRLKNDGGSSTNGWNYSDVIFLSRDKVLNTREDIQIGGAGKNAKVDSKQFYDTETKAFINDTLHGQYYVFLVLDYFDQLYEHDKEDNNVLMAEKPIHINAPNLTVSEVQIPATAVSGSTVKIGWIVKNTGDGKAFNKAITDKIYISQEPVISEEKKGILAGQFFYSLGDLEAGASTTLKQLDIKLPDGISGPYYVFVETDAGNRITEPATGAADDNITRSAGSMQIALQPLPDLVVTQVASVGNVQAGAPMSIAYKVQNRGDDFTDKQWTDYLFISQEPVWDIKKAIHLKDFPQNRFMLKMDEYGSNLTLKCPSTLKAGTYYLYLLADFNDELYELNNETNNIRRSDAFEIAAYPPVDLSMQAVTSPEPAINDTKITVEWKVGNAGANHPVSEHWVDGVYLSLDEQYSADDILIGGAEHTGPLEPGSIYSRKVQYNLPRRLAAGIYHIIVVADHINSQQDNQPNNNWKLSLLQNGTAARLHIHRGEPADLQPVYLVSPPVITAGQAPVITWRVTNAGVNTTSDKYWVDRLFLSSDKVLDNSDIPVGQYLRNDSLKAGVTYELSSTESIIPITVKGNYYLILKTDATDRVFENDKEGNNELSVAVSIREPQKTDLKVLPFSIADTMRIKDRFKLLYTVQNAGGFPAEGKMRMSYYLSRDPLKDPSDILLGSDFAHSGIPAGKEKNYSSNELSMAGAAGDYFILVEADAQNHIAETDDTNNLTASSSRVYIKVDSLELNKDKNISQFSEVPQYYSINIPEELDGQALLISTSRLRGRGEVELYVKYEDMPTGAYHDYSHQFALSTNQELMIPDLQAGTYYLMVLSRNHVNQLQDVVLGVHVRYFEVRKVETSKGGNTGNVTVKISGSKFDETTTMHLRNAAGATITASSVVYADQATVYASFPLNGAATGLYDVVAKKEEGTEAVLPGGFTVEAGKQSAVMTAVKHPESVRSGAIATMTIEFSNEGNIDIPLTHRYIISLFKAPIGLLSQLPDTTLPGVTITLLDAREPVQVLRPGAKGSVKVYSKALQRMQFGMYKPKEE
jgi:hypothetical protein